MSLGTYGQLKAAIATRMARSDQTLLIPDWITIAHFNLMNGLIGPSGDWVIPPLRIRDMLAEETLTPSEGAATLSAAFLGVRTVKTTTSGAPPLKYRPPQDFAGMGLASESGVPQFYTIEGPTLKIAPFNGADLTIWQYERIDAPEDDADTNAIFTTCPHAYLFAALAEANDHIRQHDRAGFYRGQAGGVVSGANRASDMAEISGDGLQMMPGIVA